MLDWQRMGSAPTDGTRVLIEDVKGELFVVKCHRYGPGRRRRMWYVPPSTIGIKPKRWAPLPAKAEA